MRALITNLPRIGETLKKQMEKPIATMAFPNKILKKVAPTISIVPARISFDSSRLATYRGTTIYPRYLLMRDICI